MSCCSVAIGITSIARVGRKDVSVSGESESVSASWNASYTKHLPSTPCYLSKNATFDIYYSPKRASSYGRGCSRGRRQQTTTVGRLGGTAGRHFPLSSRQTADRRRRAVGLETPGSAAAAAATSRHTVPMTWYTTASPSHQPSVNNGILQSRPRTRLYRRFSFKSFLYLFYSRHILTLLTVFKFFCFIIKNVSMK